jgi:hypothetical protein
MLCLGGIGTLMASYQLNEEVFVQDDGIWYPAAVTGCTYYSIRLSDKTLIDVPTYQMRMSATAVVHAKQVLETGTDVEAFAAGGDWQPASVVCGVLYTTSYGTTSVDCMRKAQNSTTTSSLFKRSFAGRCYRILTALPNKSSFSLDTSIY